MTAAQPERYYLRQIAFAGIGRAGQAKLAASQVVIVGCGGIGSLLAEQLTRAGVGRLKLIDRDYVEWDNLQRQVLFDEADARASLPKAVAATRKLRQINAQVQLEPLVTDLHADNVEELLRGSDLVLDGTDNFETRYLLNDACLKWHLPWIYSAAVSGYGTSLTILPGQTACLECVFPQMPVAGRTPTCATAGVINPITGLIASLAAAEALKYLVGQSEKLRRGLIWVDLWENSFRTMQVARRPDCPSCVQGAFRHLAAEEGASVVRLCGRDAVQMRFAQSQQLDLPALAGKLSALGQVEQNEFLLRFRADNRELVIFSDGRAIIKGVAGPTEARRFYAKYIGL